jgi:hypothetical protein
MNRRAKAQRLQTSLNVAVTIDGLARLPGRYPSQPALVQG